MAHTTSAGRSGGASRRHHLRDDDIDRLAREALAIEHLRPGQRDAIAAAISGRALLAVMPTGYGKSAIYQIAGAAVDGPTVVISPLIALQRDQVESLSEFCAGEAAYANSAMGVGARRDAFERLEEGDLEFLFLAPEQLARADTMDELREVGPSLFVVDEAHCISSWGHDFRPDYLRLGDVIEELGHPTVIALTATAAPPVRAEIVERLRLRDPKIVISGFDRPNLHLAVERFDDAEDKDRALLSRAMVLAAGHRTGIIYVGTRARAEELADELSHEGVRAVEYHAGLGRTQRETAQEQFMNGDVDVVVATTAFGMGIDKPNVRFVLHGDVADSIDSYYQQIGRAGRDGDLSEVALFYRPADLSLQRYFAGGSAIKVDDLLRVVAAIGERGKKGIDRDDLRRELDLNARRLTLVLTRLEDAGAVTIEGDHIIASPGAPTTTDLAAEVVAEDDRHKEMQSSRLEMMRQYAETHACRRRFLLTYFGEDYDHNCGHCDNCESGLADRAGNLADHDSPFPFGIRVRHAEFGDGLVIRTDRDRVVVLFDEAGYRTLSVELALEHGLLTKITS